MTDHMRLRLRGCLRNKKGSSMISVLVAFIILLLAIAGFSRAVRTANDLVRRAEMLNTATGEMLVNNFYPSYAAQEWNDQYVLDVYQVLPDGTKKTDSVFKLHGRLRERSYTVEVNEPGKEEPTELEYEMYFYK